jgi:SAM-dependent methyltransferase
MNIRQRSLNILSGLLKRHGPTAAKRLLWDKEFSGGHWDFIDHTEGDCVYSYLENYANKGSILDLGCGPGNTANELPANAYRTYFGVDISESALTKAKKRSRDNGRAENNHFELGDLISYEPPQHFDVILFRESMYHVPLNKVEPMLVRYSRYLKAGGVFIVRMTTHNMEGKPKRRLNAMVDVIAQKFEIVEKRHYGESEPTVLVFRPLAKKS